MILFCGDIHGDWKGLLKLIRKRKITNAHIFICGDIGIGFKGNYDKEIKELGHYNIPFGKDNNIVYCIRGNHDDPKYFDGSIFFDNIKLVHDYSIINVEGVKVLCIGGATSVDRYCRTEGKDYWKDEVFKYNYKAVELIKGVDILCTHTAIPPINLGNSIDIGFFKDMDTKLEDDINEEKVKIEALQNNLFQSNNIKNWYHGHFHASNVDNRINYTIHSLDIMELKEYKLPKMDYTADEDLGLIEWLSTANDNPLIKKAQKFMLKSINKIR